MRISQARILLTGAGGGIGSAIARQLAGSGASLLLTDVRREPLDRLGAEIGSNRETPQAVVADVTAEQDRMMLVNAARNHGTNVLINAAGINPFGLLAEQASTEIARALSINTLAPMLLCQALLPVLTANSRAHIVNIGSTFGSLGFPGFCAYSATKFAMRGFSEALRRELADTAVRVHYVAPRATSTALATDRVRAMNDELGVGMDSPDLVARAVERALREERRELLLGAPERLFAKINALFPAIVDRSVRKQLGTIRRYATRDAEHEDGPTTDTLPAST